MIFERLRFLFIAVCAFALIQGPCGMIRTAVAAPPAAHDEADTDATNTEEVSSESEGAGKAEQAKIPQRGSLSRSFTAGTSDRSIPLPVGDVTGREATPISGSVSRLGVRDWVMKVFNNDKEDTFSASVQIVQYAAGLKELKSDSFSYTLRPGQSEERKFLASANTTDCELRLLSWKNLTTQRRKEEEAKAANAPLPVVEVKKIATPPPVAVPHFLPTTPPLR